MPIAEDSAGGSPVPIPTNLTTNLTGEATGSGTLDYTTGDIDIVVTVVNNGHNHILENITDVQVNNAISGQVLKYNGNVWVNGTDENAGITAIVQDLTPQLGGNLDLNNRNITGTGKIAITGTIDGRDVSADGTKLDGIESGATADQTAAQIKTAYESNANTNNFADADVSKLSGIEPGATADQTAAQIKTAYESNADTNAFTDADHTKLDGIETAADVTDTTNVVASLTAGTNVTISAGGVISSTASGGLAHVVDDTTPQLGGNLDLNSNDITGTGNLNFTGSVTLSGTVDGRDVASDGTKLDGIEASADVTDTANVTAAGALMDSEVTNLAQVKAFDSSDYATAAQGTTADAALPKAGGTMTGALTVQADATFTGGGTGSIVINDEDSSLCPTMTFLRNGGGTTTNDFIKFENSGGEVASINSTGGAFLSALDVTGDIELADNGKLLLGASDDLQIYHDGSNSYISDTGTGDVIVKGQYIRLQDEVGTNLLTADGNDAVSLYFGGASKLSTTTSGIDVTGTVVADKMFVEGTAGSRQWEAGSAGQKLAIYAYDNSTFYHRLETGNATNYQWGTYDNIPIYTITNNSIKTTLSANGNFGVGTTNPTQKLEVAGKIQVTSTDPEIFLTDTSTGVDHSIDGNSGVGNLNIHVDKNNEGSDPKFIVNVGAADNLIVATEAGNVGVGHTSPVAKMAILGSSNSTITEANSNLCVEGGGGNGMLFGTLSTTGFKSYIQSGFVSNLGTATYDLLLNPEGSNVGVGLSAPTAKMHIKDVTNTSASTTGSTLLRLDNDVNGDLSQQKTFIDFALFDTNSNEVPQVRIGAEVGPNSDASSQEKEGEGAFVIYTNNATTGGTTPTGLNERMRVDYLGRVGIGTSSPAHELHIESTSPTIRMVDTDGSNTLEITQSGSASYLTFDNNMRFRNASAVEKLRIDSNGIDVTGDLTVSSTIEVGSLTPNQDGAIEVGVIALGTPAISSTTDSTSLRNHIIFDNPNGAVGKINTLNSATSYLTSSDYRLKTDVQEMTGSIDRVKSLRPVNFEWVVDGTRVDGFLAHEAQEVVPEAVDGEKDAMRDQQYVESEATGDIYTPAVDATYETIQVELTPAVDATYDEDGNELTPAVDATYEEQQQELTPAVDEVIHSSDVVEPDTLEEGQLWRQTTEKVMATRQVPDYQGIDQSKIVPLLTSALQDAIAKIEALETRLEALES